MGDHLKKDDLKKNKKIRQPNNFFLNENDRLKKMEDDLQIFFLKMEDDLKKKWKKMKTSKKKMENDLNKNGSRINQPKST